MPASFVSGWAKVADYKIPRIVAVYGDEPELRKAVIDRVLAHPDAEIESDLSNARTATYRDTRFKLVHITETKGSSWSQIAHEIIKKNKSTIFLVELCSFKQAKQVEEDFKTRALVINCSAPRSESARFKLIKVLAEWFSYSQTQVSIQIHKNGFRVSELIQQMRNLNRLNMPLNSDTIAALGNVKNTEDEVTEAIQNIDKGTALAALYRLDQPKPVVTRLAGWLDELARVKFCSNYLKPVNELALEVGLPVYTTEALLRHVKRYDEARISRAYVALATADRALNAGHQNGVMEVLIHTW